MGKLLTISIAAYNVEAYIRRTLDSLIDERIIDDLEIFVVDDGGTDRTLEIAKEYAAKFPNSIFPIHKENGGYGTTVNYSVAHATGKYFKLLDGDDWFDRAGLYRLVCKLRNCDEDLIITPYFKGDPACGMRPMTFPNAQWGETITVNKIKDTIGMWAIVYKTQVLRSSGLELPSHSLYTDMLYATIPFAFCERALFLNCCVYCYRVGYKGQSVSRQSQIKHIQNNIDVVERMCAFYNDEKAQQNINIDYLLLRTAGSYSRCVKIYLLMPVSRDILNKIKAYEKRTREEYPDIYFNVRLGGKTGKLLALMRKTGYLPYWLLKLIPGGVPYHP